MQERAEKIRILRFSQIMGQLPPLIYPLGEFGMSIFETEVLKVTAGGAVSVVDLEIHDDDFKMQSEEVGA
jgi:hypothetical protein